MLRMRNICWRIGYACYRGFAYFLTARAQAQRAAGSRGVTGSGRPLTAVDDVQAAKSDLAQFY
jgi:hypothetical protein